MQGADLHGVPWCAHMCAVQGVQRVQAEFRQLASTMGSQHTFIKDLSVVDDNICVWQLKLSGFDDDVPGGRQLNEDLRRLQQQ